MWRQWRFTYHTLRYIDHKMMGKHTVPQPNWIVFFIHNYFFFFSCSRLAITSTHILRHNFQVLRLNLILFDRKFRQDNDWWKFSLNALWKKAIKTMSLYSCLEIFRRFFILDIFIFERQSIAFLYSISYFILSNIYIYIKKIFPNM